MDILHEILRVSEKSSVKAVNIGYIEHNLSTEKVKQTMQEYKNIKQLKDCFSDCYDRYFETNDGFNRHSQMTQGFIGRNGKDIMKYGYLLLEPTLRFCETNNQKVSGIGNMVLCKCYANIFGILYGVFNPRSWKNDIYRLRTLCYTVRNLQSEYFCLWVSFCDFHSE